jgi:hypothetical protein
VITADRAQRFIWKIGQVEVDVSDREGPEDRAISVEDLRVPASESILDAQGELGDGKFDFKDWARNNTPGKKGFQKTGEDSFEGRLGRCYELSGRYVAFENPKATLVHGTIQGMGNPPLAHAWAELPGGDVWEPATNRVWPGAAFKGFFHPVPRIRYSSQQLMETILRTGNWGPWDDQTFKEWAHNNTQGKKGFQPKPVNTDVLGLPEEPTKEELSRAVHYLESGGMVNEGYRRGMGNDPTGKALDDLLGRTPLTADDLVVYRGVGVAEAASIADRVGGTIVVDGFLSTSASREGAKEYADAKVIRVQVPAGSRVLAIGALVEKHRPDAPVVDWDEVLFPRGGAFEVLSPTLLRYLP